MNSSSSNRLTSDTRTANNNIIIPERIRISTIRLPAKVDGGDLGLGATPLPLARIGIRGPRLHSQTINSGVVQPRLHRAVGAQVILETLPGARRKGFRGSDTLRREVG